MKDYNIILIPEEDIPNKGTEELSKWARNGWCVHSTWKQDSRATYKPTVAFLLERGAKG